MPRDLDRTDMLVAAVDAGLRSLAAPGPAARPSPAAGIDEAALTRAERRASAALMRVNHAGELAAQALYHGQAAVASDHATRAHLLAAAAEERDHLAWCAERIHELRGRVSLLAPLWYAASIGVGTLAAARGDAASLGFVAETERQVEAHIDDHLTRLPRPDARSRAILAGMAADERRHGAMADSAGASPLPPLQKSLMRLGGQILRKIAHIL